METKLTLKAIRINLGLTLEKASKLIGISKETLANYERGDTYPDVPVIMSIEKAYNIHYDNINFLIKKHALSGEKGV